MFFLWEGVKHGFLLFFFNRVYCGCRLVGIFFFFNVFFSVGAFTRDFFCFFFRVFFCGGAFRRVFCFVFFFRFFFWWSVK